MFSINLIKPPIARFRLNIINTFAKYNHYFIHKEKSDEESIINLTFTDCHRVVVGPPKISETGGYLA